MPVPSARTAPLPLRSCLLAALALVTCVPLAAAAPPDLTQGDTTGVDRKGTYNLGATGMRGWIYLKPATHFDGLQGRTTAPSRQILVTHVGAKSPADGVMQVDDVIVGIGGKFFSDDARRSIAAAIQEAEKESNNGVLELTRWRAGKTDVAQLKLQVMGSYSATAPYNCPKSKKIFDAACKMLEKEPMQEDWTGAINGLALLATGNPDYLPKLKEFAHKMGPPTMKLQSKLESGGLGAWESGYRNLFLCEYYLRTGDKAVMHAIREITLSTARGQGMYGTFGHGFADLTPDGKLHGSIPPYGPVNQAGLGANMAIVMGKKCGVSDPEIDPAIERASKFFAYFVDKGTVPYGEHEPYAYHDNNGKSAMAAVFYALQGNRPKESQFFAKMATAGFKNRECGHTGQGFSYLWSALGANVGGPAAAAAFFREAATHLDLVRRSDGSFTYDGGEQYGPGSTDDNTYYGNSSYSGLSPTATYVLTYSLALRKLCITGKDAKPADALSKQDVDAAIASGRFDLERLQMTPAQLVAAFGDWSPIVRGWAAEELAKRPEAKAMVPELLKMAQGADVHVAQGACETLGHLKSAEALPVFVRLLSHQDRWLRYKAAQSLKWISGDARPVLADILKATAQTAEPLTPINWADPVQITQGQLAAALFAGPLADSAKTSDPKLLYPAIRAIARNADGMARATLRGYFQNNLTVEDVQALAPDILAAVKTPSPADKMFSNEIRMGGFKALTKYHFKEGIAAGVDFAKTQGGHGSESRTGEIMQAIVSYGTAAREVLPQLKKLIEQFNTEFKSGHFPEDCNKQRVTSVEEAIKAIESATTQPQMRSIRK
jgi:HEAT repeat protein